MGGPVDLGPVRRPGRRPPRQLRVRILAAFLLSLAASAGALGYARVQLGEIGEGLEALDQGWLPLAAAAAELDALGRQLERDQARLAAVDVGGLAGARAGSAFLLAAFNDALGRGQRTALAAAARADDADERLAFVHLGEQLGLVERDLLFYEAGLRAALDEAETRGSLPAEALDELDQRAAALIGGVSRLSRFVEARIEGVSARTAQAQTRAYAVSGALSLLAVLLSGGLAAAALFSLRPIGSLTAQAQRLAAGDAPGRLPVGSDDEVGALAREFNAMAEAVAERDRRITERAEALDRLSVRLRRVLDSIQAGLIVVEHGHAAMVNPAAERLWGVRAGAPLPAWLSAQAPGRHEELTQGQRCYTVEVLPFGPRGALIVGEDVTERRQDRQRLARAERLALVGQMLAQVTHEVRNPLNAMSLNAELLMDELQDPEQRAMMATIEGEIRRLEEVTGRYLELARGRRVERAAASPLGIAEEVAQVEEEVLRRAGVEVRVRPRAGYPQGGLWEIDADALRRALRNLLRNSVEAGAREVWVEVDLRAGPGPGTLQVDVWDDGPGMLPDEAARAMEPFFTTKARGTGLGLAISRQELEEGGGALRVLDGGPGARLRVELPARPAPGGDPPAPDG